MKRKLLLKSLKTLMICLTANCLALEPLKIEDQISPEVKIDLTKVNLSLPNNPSNTERQKYIINTSPDNGYICHNFYREKEIKDKLFELKTLADTNKELEKKALEPVSPSYLINPSTSTSILIGTVLGIVSGFFLFNKK